MSRFIDFDQPIFFTPPSGKESGPRRLFKGGGGSSGTPYYAQQDRLFGTQADISQQLYNQYAEMAPTYLANTQGMVDDAMDGTLGRQMREQAGNNATATMGSALDANNRNMQRYGMGFNANRLLAENNRNAIMGAAQKAGAMNQASIAAEDQKWNRNAGAYGQIAGMGTGAMAGVGSAAAGYGSMGNAAQVGSMANAQGFGKFGSAIAGIGMGYAKGGEVKCNKFASGAYVRKPFVNHLKPIDWRNMPTTEQGGGNGVGSAIGSVAMGAAPIILGSLAKDIWLGDKDKHGLYSGGLRDDFRKWSKDTFGSSKKESPVTVSNSDESLINGIVDQDQSASMAAQRSALDGAVENAARDGQSDASAYGPTTSAFKFDDLSTPKASPSVDGMIKSVTAQNAPIQDGTKAFVDQGEAAAKEIARQQAEEEARRIAAEQAAQATQAASSSMDGAYARGGFIKRGVKLAMGGFAQQIDSGSFESDPDKFKTKPLTAAEQVAQRAGNGLMAAATNPLTYTRGYDKYQQILAKEAKNKSFVDSKPETPGVAETSPVEAPAQVQEVPLQEQATTPQQEFSQAFNEATAPQDQAPIDAQAAEPTPTVAEAQPADAPAADGAAPIVDGAAPSADGATVAADGAAPIADGAANADTSFISSVADTPGVAEVAPVADAGADVTEKALTETTGAAATDAAGSAADGAGAAVHVVKGLADIAAGRDAGEAVADAAAGYAGAEAGATIGSVAGPVGTVVGGVLGGVLGGSLFADGGEVDPYAHAKQEEEIDMWERMQRNAERGPGDDILHMTGQHQEGELNDQQKVASAAGDPMGVMLLKAEGGDIERADFTPGGDVQGPGTETSDDIPAWLSDGEIVHNAEAVKLAGKDALLEINDAGLEVRDGKATPEEAQAKIGQAMIQRGKELTGGSRFMKRGVKLAGGGFLGGNLGVALGAGVDQYNAQSERTERRELADRSYELQKQNNDRLNKMAEQQSTEFQWKTKDRQKADSVEQALNSAGERMTEATALQGRLNELSKDEAKAAYDAYAQAGMTPKELIGKGASEVGKIDMAKGLAFKNTAEGDLYSQTFKQLTERNAPFEEKLSALSAISPEKGMTLETQHKDTLARIEANKLAKEADERYKRERDAQIAELRREQIAARSGGAGSKSGSGKGAGSDGMKPDDLRQAFIASIPDDGFARLRDGKVEFTLSKPEAYSQATARLGLIKKLNPSMDENALINASLEATKFHNGIAPNGTVGFELDGKGNFVPTLMTREATGNRKVVIGDPVPFSQIGSIDPEKLKLTNTTAPTKEQLYKAEMQWNIQSLQEAKAAQAKFRTMTPQQVASLDPETRKRLQNLDADIPRLEALVSAYAEPANREARGAQQKTPVASEGAKQVTAPAFSDKEMQAASKLGVKAAPTSPNYKAVLDKAGDLIGADKNAFVKNVITQLNAGRLQQGDAIATVLKIKEDPNVAKLFSDDQIWALQVAAGKRI